MTHSPEVMEPTPPPRRVPPVRRSLSLERKLPLLMTAVLVAVLAISFALTYRALTTSARDVAVTRLARLGRQIASQIAAGATQRAALQRRVADDPAIRVLLRAETVAPGASRAGRATATDSARTTAARSALARLETRSDSGLPIELWSGDGRLLIRLGGDSLSVTEAREQPQRVVGFSDSSTVLRPDSTRYSEFYASDGHVYFWISTPIYENGRRIGYVADQHRIAATRQSLEGLRNLVGADVTAYYRNRDGTLWSTLAGVISVPYVRLGAPADTVFDATRPDVGPLLATEAEIDGTPWVLALELPRSAVFSRPRATLMRLGLLSLVLVVASAGVSWLISRRITRPLASLSTAAEALARGDFSQPVDDAGTDEVASLSRSFNFMRAEVRGSRMELEERIAQAHATARELEVANEQLRGSEAVLRDAKEAAETANRAKSDFLAVMSHELRTPLNAIGGYVQLLELGLHGPISDQQRDTLRRIARSQHRLLALINDVLNFAKLDAGHVRYELTEFPVDEALSALEPTIAPQVGAKGLQYTYEAPGTPLYVYADHDRLQQVVLNLLSNAIKFTPDGGRIGVQCEATVDAVLVHVRDTGVGIPPDRVRSIFEPFVQVGRSLNRPHEGVGLGLSISRDLARGMGGDLTVESEVGRGSVFTVRLPRARVTSLANGVGAPIGRTSAAPPVPDSSLG